mgnify:CR=1 FL=1
MVGEPAARFARGLADAFVGQLRETGGPANTTASKTASTVLIAIPPAINIARDLLPVAAVLLVAAGLRRPGRADDTLLWIHHAAVASGTLRTPVPLSHNVAGRLEISLE